MCVYSSFSDDRALDGELTKGSTGASVQLRLAGQQVTAQRSLAYPAFVADYKQSTTTGERGAYRPAWMHMYPVNEGTASAIQEMGVEWDDLAKLSKMGSGMQVKVELIVPHFPDDPQTDRPVREYIGSVRVIPQKTTHLKPSSNGDTAITTKEDLIELLDGWELGDQSEDAVMSSSTVKGYNVTFHGKSADDPEGPDCTWSALALVPQDEDRSCLSLTLTDAKPDGEGTTYSTAIAVPCAKSDCYTILGSKTGPPGAIESATTTGDTQHVDMPKRRARRLDCYLSGLRVL